MKMIGENCLKWDWSLKKAPIQVTIIFLKKSHFHFVKSLMFVWAYAQKNTHLKFLRIENLDTFMRKGTFIVLWDGGWSGRHTWKFMNHQSLCSFVYAWQPGDLTTGYLNGEEKFLFKVKLIVTEKIFWSFVDLIWSLIWTAPYPTQNI